MLPVKNSLTSTVLPLLLFVVLSANGNIIENVTINFNESKVYEVGEKFEVKITADIQTTNISHNATIEIYNSHGPNCSTYVRISNLKSLNTTSVCETYCNTQGNHSLSIDIYYDEYSYRTSEIVYTWNRMNEELIVKSIAAVDEWIYFYFKSIRFNFHFILDFGDETNYKHESGTYWKSFSDYFSSLRHSYSSPGIYNVTWTIWNTMYTEVRYKVIRVEYPIPNGSLSIYPLTEYIQIPDGKSELTLHYSSEKPNPTNVRCIFQYGEWEETQSVNLTNGIPIWKVYFYESAGQKNVNFTCTNDLTSQSVNATMYVESYKLSEFEFEYETPVPMNMTLERVEPTEEYRHYYRSVSVPVNVTFTISLKKFERFPSGITVIWDFGDNSPVEEFPLVSKTRTHTFFVKRGTYTMAIEIGSKYNTHILHRNITLGVIQFSCYPTEFDFRYTNVTFAAKGIPGAAIYTFYTDSSSTIYRGSSYNAINNVMNVSIYTVEYLEYGFYFPSVYGYGERVYLDQPLIADYKLEDRLYLDVRPYPNPLPPGDITLRVRTLSREPRPYVTCILKAGDAVDRDSVFYKTQNITKTQPLVFVYSYTSIGVSTISVNCSNYIADKTMTKKITVTNACFDERGMFNRQYSVPTNPMKVYKSSDLYIRNRMHIYCENEKPYFHWYIYEANSSGKTNILYSYENPFDERKSTLLIKRNALPEGQFYLLLNISLSKTWISEYSYVQFFSSLPFAYISGGDYTIRSNNSLFDALTESYVANGDFGENENLTFSWTCKRIPRVNLRGPKIILSDTSSSACSVKEVSRGVGQLASSVSEVFDYALTVTVMEGSSQNHFTQIARFKKEGSTDLQINCSLNCDDKVAVSSKLALIAWCASCKPEHRVQFEWQLWKDESGSGLQFLPLVTGTDAGKQSFVLPKFLLTPGNTYLVTLYMTVDNESDISGDVYRKLRTNVPPAGGACSFNQKTDSLVVLLSVQCSNWIDPDEDENVFTYLYETVTMRNFTHGEESVVNFIYEGSESSILDVPVQPGDPVFKYTVTVRVRIFDIYGDYAPYSSNITVIPPMISQPKDLEDVSTIESSFQNFDSKFNNYNISGNDIQTLSFLGAVAAGFKQFPFTDKTTSEEEVNGDTESINIDTSGGGPVFLVYIQKTVKLLQLVKGIVTPGCAHFIDRFKLTDIQQILSTLDALTRFEPYLSLKGVNITVDIVDTVIDCLEYGSRRTPLSPSAVEILTDIANVYHRVLDNVLNKMLPRKLQNLEVELSEDDIRAEIMLHINFFLQQTGLLKQNQGNVTSDYQSINRQVDFIYQIKAHERELQLQQRETARKCIPIIKQIQTIFLNVMHKTIVLGERLYWNANHVLEIMMKKIHFNDIENARDEFFGGVRKVNGSINHTSYLEFAVSNYLRNPYIYGENASKAISSVPVIDIPQNISVDSNIPNKGNLKFKRYIPLINPHYPEQMIYFSFELINSEDAALIHIKPDGFDFLGHQKVPSYSFYFSSSAFPTSSFFDYKKVLGVRDWTKYGFKVFLPGDKCGKGLCYLGIKPLKAPVPDDFSGSRKRRATYSQTTIRPPENATLIVNAADFVPVEANFSLIFTTTGCRTWENGKNLWTMEGCEVLPMSDLNNTVCRCIGNTFSTSFYVPANTINFLTVWGKFDASNATVYGALVVVFVIYIILLIVLQRQDKKDRSRSKVSFLCDHITTHTYFYLISVYTGFRRGAGTKSNVYFILTGDDDDSGIRFLNDGFQEGFSTSSVNMYFFGTNEPLGDLRYIRIWHDNSGPPGFKSWFLSKIIIENLEQRERYTFHCNKWLGIDDEDCTLDRIIPVSTPDNLSYNDRISVEAQAQMPVYHLWLSLLYRPQLGKFTRVQRLSCLVALLCLTMITNAMFFRSSDENENVEEVNFGIFRLSFGTVYVSCIGMLISTPPVTFAAFVFRNTKNSKSAAHKIANSKEQSSDKSFSNLDGDVFTPSKGTLPRWVFYVAWVSVVLAILSSSFFLILYSMEWGKSKSNEWLSSLAFSILESFIVFDPIKVLFFAIICSTVFKSLMMEELHKVNVENLRLTSKSTNVSQRTTFSDLANKVLPKCDTFSKEEINKLRKKCREETQARSALTNLVVFILYILAIYGISFTQRDQRSLSMKQNLDNHLLLGSHGFSSLKGRKDFISWMNETFIPTYYPNASYAGKPLTVLDRQWFKDMASIRVGPARLRQVRMKTGTCPYSYLPWSYPCVDSYSETEEDKNSYCLRWKPYNDTICGSELYKSRFYTAEAWRYTDAVEIWGMSRMGEYKTYSGGGYILKFVKDKVNAHLLIKELLDNNWIDRKTRAIFVEFTIYNPNVNLFTYSMYLVEFSEVGSAFTWTDTQAFKPVLNLSSLGFTIVMCYVFFLFYYIFMLFKIILQCREIGCIRFIKEPWNFVDCLCTFLAYSCLVAFILRMKYTNTAMDMFYDDKLTGANRFINYGHIVMWDNAFNVLFATLLFVSTIQILKILGYNKRFTEVISVISNVGKDLLAFGALLLILFVSFVLYAYLLFGSKLESYKSIYQTCGSLANTFIGKNKLDPLIVAAPLSAQFFYSVYVLCVIMFMLTIFMAILNTSISAVRAETVASAAKIGMLDIVKKFVKNILEVFQKPRKSSRVNRKQEHSANEEINAANVLGLVREIVCVYGNIETKLSNKKYSVEDYQRSLLSPTSRPTFCKVKNRYNEIFDQKHTTEHLEMKEKGASRETFRQEMSRMSYVSASNVEMHIPLCDSDEIDAQRERYQFTIF